MEFNIKSGSPEKQRAACVVVGVHESRKLSFSAELLDRLSNGFISDVLKRGDFDGRLGSSLMLYSVPNVLSDRVLLVGLGKEREFKAASYRKAILTMAKVLNEAPISEAVCYLTELPLKKQGIAWAVAEAVIGVHSAIYRFNRFKTKPEDTQSCRKLTLSVTRRSDLVEGELGLKQGLAIGRAMTAARDLGNTPANFCTPEHLAQFAQQLVNQYAGVSCEIFDEIGIRELGMNSFLSVAKGSQVPPRFIVLTYQHEATHARSPIVLVGKGVTFDSGGISLKPGEGMDEMKYDMMGAATVLGTFQAVAEMQLPLNLIALVPACENLPSGCANKPGDIVTAMSGKTIEILNTDAEGRLILCDALTYAERFKPEAVIDVATLTGACVIALGHHVTGLFSNQSLLAEELVQAGEDSGDRAWNMPLYEEYQQQLKSPFADLANIGGRPAGSITAACFLANFTEAYEWAHLDIAGTAWKSGQDKGATGRPIPLLTRFLIQRAQSGTPHRKTKSTRDTDDMAERDDD